MMNFLKILDISLISYANLFKESGFKVHPHKLINRLKR